MPIDMTEIEELERLLEKATPQNIDTAEIKEAGWYECPWCNGQGEVEGTTYINYDNIASNVQFSGIGPEFGHAEALFRAVVKHLPSLLAEIKRGREEIAKLRGVVSASATQFEFYVEQHLAKSPPDTAKAVVNKAHAEQCRAALEGKDNG